DLELHALGEVLDRALGDLGGVLLKPVGRVEEDGPGRGATEARHDVAVRRHHGGGGLPRAHDDEQPGRAHRKNPWRTASPSSAATSSGTCESTSWWAGENQCERRRGAAATATASARRLAAVRRSSPVSARMSIAGTLSVGYRVDGRCSQSDRRIRRW